jgi:fused signal recognition particle receptor
MTIFKKIATDEPKSTGLFSRLGEKLSATRETLSRGFGDLLLGKKTLDADLLEQLEARLLTADVGPETTQRILDQIAERISRKHLTDTEAVRQALKDILLEILAPCAQPLVTTAPTRPFVIMVVGVNGTGKTTTIGKLAHKFKQQGYSVMLAAADTFRAAAKEQLQAWATRSDAAFISQPGRGDAAAITHDALRAAAAQQHDILIIDTAGRLHTQTGLMDELKKIKRVMAKVEASAPHEVLLVLDAGNGQNILSQWKNFDAAVGVTGLCLTKLDGTAKGGVLFALAAIARLPIRYIGVGEDLEDLRDFDAAEFVEAILPAQD